MSKHNPNPPFIVHDRVGSTWHFESEAQMLGFVALEGSKYTVYYRDDYVARLRERAEQAEAGIKEGQS